MASILIVDDDAELCNLLRLYLGRLGHCVSVVHGGQEALAFLEGCTPDLVVADVMMPGMDGLELLRRLKADGRLSVPVLVYTGCQEHLGEARRLGADACLAKGDSLQAFRDVVTGLLKSKEARGLCPEGTHAQASCGEER